MTGLKATVVLVHGAFQDGNCWKNVAAGLRKGGHNVVVINLPGRGGDGVDPHSITSETYCEVVRKAVVAQPAPVVLVGHSFGGITISNVAEAVPERIRALVYLSAYLPKDGESLQMLSQTDADSDLGKDGNFVVSPDHAYASILAENGGELFGNDAGPADREAIAKSLIAEPLGPMTVPSKLSSERFGRVPKYYIETTRDVVVSPSLQELMMKEVEIRKVFKIDAGHASYITKPDEVLRAIEEIAAQK